MKRILVVGEALVDIVHRLDGTVDEHPGGSPLNVAIGLARLGHPVEFASRYAHDRYGDMIAEHLSREQLLSITEGTDGAEHTSTAKATLSASGAATYEFDLDWDVAAALDDAPVGHLHTGSIGATVQPGAAAVLAAVQRASRTGTVSYDPNARPTLMGEPDNARATVERIIALCDVVKASDEDIAWLYPDLGLRDVLRHWGELGASLVVATAGADGVHVFVARSTEYTHLPAGTAGVVDTVGAGDSFMSGLLSGLLDAELLGSKDAAEELATADLSDVLPAVQRGLACGAITVSRAGANPPTRDELGKAFNTSQSLPQAR